MAEVIDMPLPANPRGAASASPSPGGSPALPPPPPPPPTSRKRSLSCSPPQPPPPRPPGSPVPLGRGRRSSRSRSPQPSRRRSPPPSEYKRPRREDGGSDRRRGYGHDDRRYGYDHGVLGGRVGNGDERGHGRYMNRGAPDRHDFGRSGRNEGFRDSHREGLMSYKQFIQELEDDVLPVEAQCRYEEYRSEYITTQKKAYFDLHKGEDWLKNKYHPNNLDSVIERRNELARTKAKQFFHDLQTGNLDLGPGFMNSAANKSGHGSNINSDDEADLNGKKRRHVKGPTKENYSFSAAPKAHPVCSEARRIQDDVEQAQALICKLDTEKGIEENILSGNDHDKSDGEKSHGSMGPIVIVRGSVIVKGLEGTELLDTLITYLWRVHGVDYYGMSETSEAKGLRHERADSKSYDGASSSAVEWEKKLDSFWQQRLQGQDPMEILKAKDKIDAAAVEILVPCVRKIRDEKYGWKYGCGAQGCTKLFHAPEFVHKHLKLKHPEIVVELTAKVREDIYFENYMNDPNAPGGTPIMQQSASREKGRQRPSMDSRLRDERGSRRDYGRSDRGDMNDDSPAHDRSNESPDDLMYDSYGDPAPPVLMPVPGAGPLGPFVPAPPEVAIRMLRDQGGPPPFEPTAGPRPRKGGRGGGPASVLPVPPPFVHDPRRIRSYQDLDAPEDEVTVMDYRSL